MNILRFVLHLAPLVPLILEMYYFCAALLLFVSVFYIKTFKIRQQIEDLDPDVDEDQKKQLLKLMNRWRVMTFLKDESTTHP